PVYGRGPAGFCASAQDVTAHEVVVQVHEAAHADVEGGGAVGEFIAVQRHARFQAEAVARRETATGDPGGIGERAPDGFGVVCGEGDFEAVFARVARAREPRGQLRTADPPGRGQAAVITQPR